MPWLDDVAAVLQAWYPGQEAGNAIADVLFGDAEPGGRLPQTFPARWADNPTGGRDPEIYPGRDGKVRYAEGLFVGYRHYDRAGIAPLFAFGHGLSYTRFELTGLSADADAFATSRSVMLRASVRNSGARAGSTVLQVYVHAADGTRERPQRELKAFAKIHLAPGEARTVPMELTARDFAFYDVDNRQWQVETGTYDLLVGFSASEIVERVTVTLDGCVVPRGRTPSPA